MKKRGNPPAQKGGRRRAAQQPTAARGGAAATHVIPANQANEKPVANTNNTKSQSSQPANNHAHTVRKAPRRAPARNVLAGGRRGGLLLARCVRGGGRTRNLVVIVNLLVVKVKISNLQLNRHFLLLVMLMTYSK